ncbi:MAG: TROVE domain-containing protein [Sporichthyaceae bacterium]
MAKFNNVFARARASGPVLTAPVSDARTREGGAGYLRTPRGELFLLAISNLVGEDTFYERARDRDDRFCALVRELALTDVEWLGALLRWLRAGGNLRSAPLVGACVAVKARLDAGMHGSNRELISSVCLRADEPGELLAFWTATFGRAVPKPVKRGLADAVGRLYDERALLKYDSPGKGYRFGDVLELVHPSPVAPWQGDLFGHALDRRHGRDKPIPESLRMLRARAALMAVPVQERREALDADRLRAAGMTWEAVSGWLQGPLDRAAWEAVIPSMGFMALLRNLRNFDEAGVSDEVAARVCARLADPAQVERSRQLPFRFYSAHRAAPSLRWGHALEQALASSLRNVPELAGRTLVLVDTSGSMRDRFSRDGTVLRWDAAALFGVALARRCASANLVSFSSTSKEFPVAAGASLLRALERWKNGGWFQGGGTETWRAVREHLANHDRVVIVTDEQAFHDRHGSDCVPARIPVYTWNLAGYRAGHAPSSHGNRHAFGGLNDAAFRMIPLLEGGRDAGWPWE